MGAVFSFFPEEKTKKRKNRGPCFFVFSFFPQENTGKNEKTAPIIGIQEHFSVCNMGRTWLDQPGQSLKNYLKNIKDLIEPLSVSALPSPLEGQLQFCV